MARRRARKLDPFTENRLRAQQWVATQPIFRSFCPTLFPPASPWLQAAQGWAYVTTTGRIHVNEGMRGSEAEWRWVLAHCLLHMGMGHLDRDLDFDRAYVAARCASVMRFQEAAKLGTAPDPIPAGLPSTDEAVLTRLWRSTGIPEPFQACGVAGSEMDLIRAEPSSQGVFGRPSDWPKLFAVGLASAATAAIDVAGGARSSLSDAACQRRPWELALGWFVSSYPLLGGLASQMTIVADVDLARSRDISVAAVSPTAGEIYVNPLVTLSQAEWRFVLAHEMLHAALRHGDRIGPRDPFLWNVACDFVINGWLVEMGVGQLPELGALYDPDFKDQSAEELYDRIANDLRRFRKLATLRGHGLGDVLGEPIPWARQRTGAIDLDEYYRRALVTGLVYHESGGRGLIPAGLVEEIRALDQPPLPWDARLARWFDEFVPSPEKRRSYARLSRRQSATPDIPRPGWLRPEELARRNTFGVVLDTSGSMSHELLGKALGAIASYSLARDVPAARVIFCDAAAYDAGYLPVEEIASKVKVHGRGGTELQPGIDLLERAEDFPPEGPILLITDAQCDVVRIRRDHAFLIPDGARLPFTPHGPVFYLA